MEEIAREKLKHPISGKALSDQNAYSENRPYLNANFTIKILPSDKEKQLKTRLLGARDKILAKMKDELKDYGVKYQESGWPRPTLGFNWENNVLKPKTHADGAYLIHRLESDLSFTTSKTAGEAQKAEEIVKKHFRAMRRVANVAIKSYNQLY